MRARWDFAIELMLNWFDTFEHLEMRYKNNKYIKIYFTPGIKINLGVSEGRLWLAPLKDVHVLIPRTCEYVPYMAKGMCRCD